MYTNRTISRRRHYQLVHLAACILIIIMFITMARPAHAQVEWRPGFQGHGTIHEQLGQVHFPHVSYSEYVTKANYSEEPPYSTMGLDPVYRVSHWLLNIFYDTNVSYIPPGYIEATDENTIVLGHKTRTNDWADLLAHNKLIIFLWILPLLICIAAIPFIAVIYCCFCCCRCQTVCPPCDKSKASWKKLICSLMLLLLIIGIMLGLLIAFVANKQIGRGFQYTNNRVRRGAGDTCVYLKDVNAHVDHLYVKNYEELTQHLIDQTANSYLHILLDLADTSDTNAVTELERILNNLDEAQILMQQVDEMEKDLRFFGAQLRDGLRGAKREAYRTTVIYCGRVKCIDYIKRSGLLTIDTSKCLHFDLIPNTTVYVEALQKASVLNLGKIARRALARLNVIGDKLKEIMAPTIPPLTVKLDKGAAFLKMESEKILNVIDAAISDVYLRTLRSGQTYSDIHDNFERELSIINIMICVILTVILILLILGLIFGLGSKGSNTGSNFLLVAIMLIFCVLSFIMLVGLFYFIFGLVTYEGACAQLKAQAADSKPKNVKIRGSVRDLQACKEDETILEMLQSNNLYDTSTIRDMVILDDYDGVDEAKWHEFKGDLTKVSLITPEERVLILGSIEHLRNYKSSLYSEHLCQTLAPKNISRLSKGYYSFGIKTIYKEYEGTVVGTAMWQATSGFVHTYRDLTQYADFEPLVKKLIVRMKEKLSTIDKLILGENLNFGETIDQLLNSIQKSENYIVTRGTDFINTIGENLTKSIAEQMDGYKEMLLEESVLELGHCKPLAYIYKGDLKYVCHQVIDPINAFWLGVLICALLLIPTLFVAHRLMCMYRVVGLSAKPVVRNEPEAACPVCSVAPVAPKPIIFCTGGQQAPVTCDCTNELSKTKTD